MTDSWKLGRDGENPYREGVDGELEDDEEKDFGENSKVFMVFLAMEA